MPIAIASSPVKRSKPKKVKDDSISTLTLRLRIKDKHDSWLDTQAKDVSFTWNYINETAYKILERENRFVSAFDLHPLMKGAQKEGLDLHSQTLQAVAEEYVLKRKAAKRAKLRWRVSKGPRKSLGWIPFKAAAVVYKHGQVFFRGKALSLWDSYGLSNYKLGTGNISQDARGRWYFNVTVEVKKIQTSKVPLDATKVVGIDLGLKDVIASNDGLQIEAQKFYRKLEDQLANAQRSTNKHRTRAIHAKIANQRKDFNHKQSTALVHKYKALFVGNVSAQKMTQTHQAKSVLDAGWSQFRTMLQYKCDNAGVWFKEINESYTTQECSVCTEKTGPKGLEGLKVRHWICPICNTPHQRDINAATNIQQRGIKWLLEECSVVIASTDSIITNKADANSPGSDIGPLAEGIPSL